LSRKIVSGEQAKLCENNYKTSKYIYDLVNQFIRKMDKDHEMVVDTKFVYDRFIWPLSLDPEYLVFSLKSASKDFDKVYKNILADIKPILIDCFKEILVTKFKEKDVQLEAVLDITCFEPLGIKIIRNALLKSQELANEEFPFKIKLVKSPYYSITLKTSKQNEAIQLINQVIEMATNYLIEYNATVKIVKQPIVIIDKEFEPEKSEDESESTNSLGSSMESSMESSMGSSLGSSMGSSVDSYPE